MGPCRCGHVREMHNHSRTYCGKPDGCDRYRPAWLKVIIFWRRT